MFITRRNCEFYIRAGICGKKWKKIKCKIFFIQSVSLKKGFCNQESYFFVWMNVNKSSPNRSVSQSVSLFDKQFISHNKNLLRDYFFLWGVCSQWDLNIRQWIRKSWSKAWKLWASSSLLSYYLQDYLAWF